MPNRDDVLQPGKWLEGAAGYEQRSMRQLHAWAYLDRSFHNPIDNECVPDLSCCNNHCRGADGANRPWVAKRLRLMFYDNPASRPAIMQDILGTIEQADPMQLLDVDVPGREYAFARLEKGGLS